METDRKRDELQRKFDFQQAYLMDMMKSAACLAETSREEYDSLVQDYYLLRSVLAALRRRSLALATNIPPFWLQGSTSERDASLESGAVLESALPGFDPPG
jgi:hypothetical protein